MNPKDWETDGTHNGATVFCPENAYCDCPYCDQCNICHVADPVKDCSEFYFYYPTWDDYFIMLAMEGEVEP